MTSKTEREASSRKIYSELDEKIVLGHWDSVVVRQHNNGDWYAIVYKCTGIDEHRTCYLYAPTQSMMERLLALILSKGDRR